MQEGEKVVSAQSGFAIALPGKRLGRIKVVSLFGDNETNEGAVCEVISGDVGKAGSGIYVMEAKD
jgi:hypothetical protein